MERLRQRQRQSVKPTFPQILGEVGVALVALSILVGAAVSLPVLFSRFYAIGLTAAMLIVSIFVLAFRSRRNRPAR